jgi:hypothetical protein
MQFYDNTNAFGGFILDVFIQNRLRSYFTLLRSFRSFRSYLTTRVPSSHGISARLNAHDSRSVATLALCQFLPATLVVHASAYITIY